MNLANFLSCLLLVLALCLWGIQRVQSEEVEIVPRDPQHVSQNPSDVENTKQKLRRAVELAVLKGSKYRRNKVKMHKTPKVANARRGQRNWKPWKPKVKIVSSMHYPQLSPFMIPPAYAVNPAMPHPYYSESQFPGPGYQNPVQKPRLEDDYLEEAEGQE